MLSLSDLLRPIPGPNPSGKDLRYTPIYDQIREARLEDDPDLPQGVWEYERKVADWRKVVSLCTDALINETKDLQVASWLTEALLHRDGLSGLAEGLTLLGDLVEHFWFTLYPNSEDDELELRAAPLEWLGSRLEMGVKQTPLNPTGLNWFGLTAHKSGLPREAGGIVDSIAKRHLQARLDDLDSCLRALGQLRAICETRFGDVTPRLDGLRNSIETVRHTLESFTGGAVKTFEPEAALAETDTSEAVVTGGWASSNVPLDMIHFTVTAPFAIDPGSSAVVTLWVHLESQREAVRDRAYRQYRIADAAAIMSLSKGPVRIARGVILTVRLEVTGAYLDDAEDSVLWDGEIGCANFVVTLPVDSQKRTLPSKAVIYLNGVQIAKIQFILQVGAAQTEHTVPTIETRVRRAFASYATADREEVLGRLQGIRKAAPYMEIFFDVLALRSGQHWESEIERIVSASDIFYLFWSLNASNSAWVEREWRTALGTGRRDFIDPVPLQTPEEAPPPPELAGLHFNDWMLAFQRRKHRNRVT